MLDAATLQSYVGAYGSASGTFTVTLEGSQLMVELTGQSPLPVFASAKDAFYYKIVNAQIVFGRSATGAVTTLTLQQNGLTIPATRRP